MITEAKIDTFRNSPGREANVSYIETKEIQSPFVGEGPISLIQVISVDNYPAFRTFVLKNINQSSSEPDPETDPLNQMRKWTELREAGAAVSPTFRINDSSDSILVTDLTQNGRYELFDPIDFMRKTSRGRDGSPPKWVWSKKNEILFQIANNSKKAASARYAVSLDGYFFLHDPESAKVKVILGDLGKGVIKQSQSRRFDSGRQFVWNLNIAVDSLCNINVYKHEDIDSLVTELVKVV